MKMMLSVLYVLGICGAAGADCRARVFVQPNVVVQTPVITYQQIQYPLYTATYSGFTASSEAILSAKLDQLGQRLDALGQRLEALAQQQRTDPKQGAVKSPGLAYLMQTCAKCHDSGVAKAKGGGHVFFDLGQMVATPEQQWSMSKQVRIGEMPKGGPKATDEQYQAVLEFFEEASAERAAQKQMPKIDK